MNSAERTVVDLVREIPYFEDVLLAHSFAPDVVLPHVFFSLVLEEVMADFNSSANSFDRAALFAFLERCLADRQEEVVEVVTTSFIDDLPWPGQEGEEIVDELPPLLAEEYRRSHSTG